MYKEIDSHGLLIFCQVPSELRDALIRAIGEENNIRRMQFRSMAANTCTIPGSLLIGDAFNMRHPLSAGGMTVALSDIVVLRHLLKPLPNFTDANAVLQRFYTLRKVSVNQLFSKRMTSKSV